MKPVDSLTDDDFAALVQRAARLPDAPPSLLRAALDLWPQAHQPTTLRDLAVTARQIIRAVLSFDSWAQPVTALGMRSVGSDTRHLLFSAMGRDVDLRISRAANAFALTGQILGPDEQGTIELVSHIDAAHADEAGDAVPASRSTALDELGEFRLTDIRAGTYVMTLRMGDEEIVLPPITVGEKAA